MTTPERAHAAAEHFAAARPPIRQGAAMPRTRRAAPVVEQEYDDEPAAARRQRTEYAPEPHRRPGSGGVLWGIAFLVIGVAMGCLLITRGYIPIPQEAVAMPTAGIIIVAAPTPNDYGVPAYNAMSEADAAAQDSPTATEAPRLSPTAPVPQEAAGEGGEAIEAGRVAAPVAPIIRATQTAAPVLSVESERGGEAIEAGRVARPVVQMGATPVEEGGAAAGAGSFARKVGKP